MRQAPFTPNPVYTAIAIEYRNRKMIADQVLPRVQVSAGDFKYRFYPLADGFTVPDTTVGRLSPPNRVETSSTDATASTIDRGLDDSVPQADIDNAANVPGYDPLARATMFVSNLIELDREIRAASLVFDNNQYATSNRTTLSGTTQWSDFTNSDPVKAILTALDGMTMRANIMVIGSQVATQLSMHPKVLQAVYKTLQGAGVAAMSDLAKVLDLEEIVIGQALVNTAKKGQTATLGRAWGKHCSLIYRDNLADASRGTTFGFTGQFGTRVAGNFEDRDIGLNGGQRVRVGESVVELITAGDLGYFFQNAVA